MIGNPDRTELTDISHQVETYFDWCKIVRYSSLTLSENFLQALHLLQQKLLDQGAIRPEDRILIGSDEQPVQAEDGQSI